MLWKEQVEEKCDFHYNKGVGGPAQASLGEGVARGFGWSGGAEMEGSKGFGGEEGRAAMEDHFGFVMDAEKRISRC